MTHDEWSECALKGTRGDMVFDILRDWNEDILFTNKLAEVTYAMARHIRNTDKMDALEWGIKGCDLLAKLREFDSEKYDSEVK